MNLDLATKILTHHLIWDDSIESVFKQEKIIIDQWPESEQKQLAKKFQTLIENGNDRSYARFQVQEKLESLIPLSQLIDVAEVIPVYEKQIKFFRAQQLANQIMRDPTRTEEFIEQFHQNSHNTKIYNYREELPILIQKLEKEFQEKKSMRVIPGWEKLSKQVGGFNPGRVGLIIAKTGFGKTNFAISLLKSAAELGNVLYVNQEMIKDDFAEKILMSSSEIEYSNLKSDIVRWFTKVKTPSSIKNIFFTNGTSMKVQEIYSLCKNIKPWFIVVDYDQKIDVQITNSTPEWKALQKAVEHIEMIAKDLEIFVLLLSQEGSDGDVAASKRSKNPATFVLRFHREYGEQINEFLLTCIKNRFGPNNFSIQLEYIPSMALVKEGEFVFTKEEIEKKTKGSFRV